MNIFASLSKENYKRIRESVIGMVLATDMSNHFSDIAKLKSRLGARTTIVLLLKIADFDMTSKDK